jgi:predicted phosphodiesterase
MTNTQASERKSNNKTVTKLVNEIMAKHPSLPSRQLARMLYRQHPLVFNSEDNARQSIRYRRGAIGDKGRRNRGLEAPITPRIELPQSDERQFEPFIMDGCERILVLPDIHVPYHTRSAIELAIAEGKRRNVDGILLSGDQVDFHTLSRFERDPEARDFAGERAIMVQLLGYLRQEFPDARIIYKEGNHDERLRSYIVTKAPELYGIAELRLEKLFDFERLGIEHVGEKRTVMLGGLSALHGHEFHKGFAPPVNPARGAYLKAKVSVLIGHHHKTSEHTETSLDGSIVTTWSMGCLSDLRPPYAPYNSYNHGLANVELRGQSFNVTNHRIHRGVLLN